MPAFLPECSSACPSPSRRSCRQEFGFGPSHALVYTLPECVHVPAPSGTFQHILELGAQGPALGMGATCSRSLRPRGLSALFDPRAHPYGEAEFSLFSWLCGVPFCEHHNVFIPSWWGSGCFSASDSAAAPGCLGVTHPRAAAQVRAMRPHPDWASPEFSGAAVPLFHSVCFFFQCLRTSP